MDTSQLLDFLAQCSSKPTLILSSSGVVLSSNKGSARLFAPNFHDQDVDLITSRSVFELGISLLPGKKPVYRNLNSLLEAAAAQLRQSSDKDVQMTEPLALDSHGDRSSINDNGNDPSFWDEQDNISSVQRIDVIIPRNITPVDARHVHQVSSVRAHLRVQALQLQGELFFKLTFRRPTIDHLSFIPDLKEWGEVERRISPQPIPRAGVGVLQGFRNPIAQHGLCDQMVGRLIPHCAGILDADGQVIFLSDSWYAFTGMADTSSLGTEWAQTLHPDDREGMLNAWAEVIGHGGDKWTYEARFRMKDGSYRYFLVRAQPFLNEDGKLLRWYTTMLDVHDSVLDKKEREQHRQSVFDLLSQADVSLWGVNQAHEIYVRAGALCWDPCQKPDDMDSILVPGDGSLGDYVAEDDVKGAFQTILDGELTPKTLEHQVGDRWYRTRIVAELEQNTGHKNTKPVVQAALGLTIDVTDVRVRTSLEIENERLLTGAAKEASRLKSQFLANMSHEIRTPIAGIIGLSELLAEDVREKESQELLTGIQQSAGFLLMLINDILDFSKIESGHMEIESVPFQPSKVIDELRMLMGVQVRDKGLDLVCDNSLQHELSVLGDPGRLRQILTNLLSNSVKFTSKGSVTLSVKPIKNEAETSNISELPRADDKTMLQFVVRDTGCGISEESMRKLFQPFSQADASTARTHGGTGLGLSISRQLAELMGGSIHLASNPSVGTTATLNIPYLLVTKPESTSPPETLQPPQHTAASATASLSKKAKAMVKNSAAIHVLVVEDNAVNSKIAVAKVRKLGHSVSAVWNGEEALAYLDACSHASADHPMPSIVLMDCMMPVLDGYQATGILRRDGQRYADRLRNLPVVAMTASAVQGEREKCREAGMDDYLTKPVTQDVLEQMIQKWVRNSDEGKRKAEEEAEAEGGGGVAVNR